VRAATMHLSPPPSIRRSAPIQLSILTRCQIQKRPISILCRPLVYRKPSSIDSFVRLPGVVLGARYIHPRGPTKPLPVPNGKFDIVFFGGDQFSCLTLKKLEEARGKSLVMSEDDPELTILLL
jgi:hypothetical protein